MPSEEHTAQTPQDGDDDDLSRREVLALSAGGVGLLGFLGWHGWEELTDEDPTAEEEEECRSTDPISFDGPIESVDVDLGVNDGVMRASVTVEAAEQSRYVDLFVNGESHTSKIPPSPDSVLTHFEFCTQEPAFGDGCVKGIGRPDFVAQLRQNDTVQDRVGFTVEQSESGWDTYRYCYALVAREVGDAE